MAKNDTPRKRRREARDKRANKGERHADTVEKRERQTKHRKQKCMVCDFREDGEQILQRSQERGDIEANYTGFMVAWQQGQVFLLSYLKDRLVAMNAIPAFQMQGLAEQLTDASFTVLQAEAAQRASEFEFESESGPEPEPESESGDGDPDPEWEDEVEDDLEEDD
jgi:hypothetical protein